MLEDHVTALEPEQRLGIRGGWKAADFDLDLLLDPSGGGTEVTFDWTLQPKSLLMKVAASLLEQDLRPSDRGGARGAQDVRGRPPGRPRRDHARSSRAGGGRPLHARPARARPARARRRGGGGRAGRAALRPRPRAPRAASARRTGSRSCSTRCVISARLSESAGARSRSATATSSRRRCESRARSVPTRCSSARTRARTRRHASGGCIARASDSASTYAYRAPNTVIPPGELAPAGGDHYRSSRPTGARGRRRRRGPCWTPLAGFVSRLVFGEAASPRSATSHWRVLARAPARRRA